MTTIGMLDSLDRAAELVQVTRLERPDPVESETYARLLPIFDNAYEALRTTFADLTQAADRLPMYRPSDPSARD